MPAIITTRAGKGAPLTNTEVDANFTNLQTTANAAETTANAAADKAYAVRQAKRYARMFGS